MKNLVLNSGIRELEAKLADISQKNAVLTEEKESYKSHNEALIKEVERQDKVIRKLGRQVDTFAAVNADFANMVEPLFKLIRGLRVSFTRQAQWVEQIKRIR